MSDVLMTILMDVRDLPALINAGADTFLIAIDKYSTGAYQMMSLDQAEFASKMAAGFGKKISLLVDKLFHEGELDEEEEIARKIHAMDVQYVLFQDPGFYLCAKKYGFVDKLIYKPDTLMTSVNEILFWKERGVRAAISPLVTLQETEQMIASEDALVTVHGHTLMSRSARPLFSAWQETFQIGEDMKHRHDLTIKEMKREGHMPVYEDENGAFIYSDEVLVSFQELKHMLGRDTVIFVDGLFLERMALIDAVRGYRMVMNGADGKEIEKSYCEKYAGLAFGKGYYDAKTVK